MPNKPVFSAADWSDAREALGLEGLLSVILPAYQLHNVIGANIDRVCSLLRGNLPFEIVPVNDGSDDGTAQAIAEAAGRHPEVHPVYLEGNRGKGAALLHGFEHCRGSFVLLLDADLDLPPEQIAVFFSILRRNNADVVIGSKRHPESRVDYPWRRRLTSWAYYGFVRLLIGLPVHDTQTGIKLFRREALKCAFDRMLVKRYAFDLEVLSIVHHYGYRIAEAPVEMNFGDKIGCLSGRTVREIATDTLAIVYRLRWLRYYQSLNPLRMPEPPPRVSVIIACPALTPMLDDCLRGLALQTMPPHEVLVLPDAATRSTTETTAGGHAGQRQAVNNNGVPDMPEKSGQSLSYKQCRIVPTGKLRPAEKRNLGIARATGDIVAFLDDDTIPAEHWIERALPYFSEETVGAVGGPAVTPNNESTRALAGGRVYANRLVSGGYRYRYFPDRVRRVDDLPSCNLMVRRSLLAELGGFRTNFWPGEDTLLCLDLTHKLKRVIVYDPWVQVAHRRRPLFGPHLRQVGRYALHRGFFVRHFPDTSRRIGYMLPSLFVLGVIGGLPLCLAWHTLRAPYLGVLTLYVIVTLLAALHRRPAIWMLTWLGIMATHLVYGTRFLQGLFSRRMPEAILSFDHVAATDHGKLNIEP